MGHERGQVLQPLAQRREPDREDVEPEEQVLPEVAVGHRILQPAIGGRDDPHVHPLRALGAEPLQLAGLERAEQLGLGFGAEIADLVEEQRPLVRQLEPAEPALGGAGERAPLVPEHLGLDEVPRDGGAVDGDERARRPAARPVDRRGRQLLPGAALAGEEDAGLGGRDPGHQGPDLRHGRALTHQRRAPRELRVQRAILGARPVELDGGPHRDQHRFRGQRLLEKLEGAELYGAHGVGELRLAAHHDDGRAAAPVADARQGREPVGPRRHEQIEQDDVGVHVVELQQRRVPVRRLGHREPLLAEQRGQHPADVGLVVHQEDLGACRSPAPHPHDERRPTAGRRLERDRALVHLDRLLGERQAEPGAAALSGDVRIEQPPGEVGRHAGAVIADLDPAPCRSRRGPRGRSGPGPRTLPPRCG